MLKQGYLYGLFLYEYGGRVRDTVISCPPPHTAHHCQAFRNIINELPLTAMNDEQISANDCSDYMAAEKIAVI